MTLAQLGAVFVPDYNDASRGVPDIMFNSILL